MDLLSDAILAGGFSGHGLGIECAGIVTAVGNEVENIQVGDEVVALAPYALSSYVTTKAIFVAAKPPNLSFAQAAGLPTVFTTAVYVTAGGNVRFWTGSAWGGSCTGCPRT